MTEQEWLECAEPTPMLEFLRGQVSDRKLRLFAVACCRRIECLLVERHQRASVSVAERHADGVATDDELEAAQLANDHELFALSGQRAEHAAKRAAYFVAIDDAYWAAMERRAAAYAVIFQADPEPLEWWEEPRIGDQQRFLTQFAEGDLWLTKAGRAAAATEAWEQSRLLRDIFGNPFRPVTVDPSWRTATVTSLATVIYEERAVDRLPILADALEDAGCDNPDILNHCRQPGHHVRGCWALDLVLNKK
jgi:hypothetical protein